MDWLLIVCIVFSIFLGAIPALIRQSHQAQWKALSIPLGGPRVPVWTTHVQAVLSVGAWCAAAAFGFIVTLQSRQSHLTGFASGENYGDVGHSRVALFSALLLSQGSLKLNAVVLHNVGTFGVLWICAVSAGVIAGIASIVLVSVRARSPVLKLAATFIPSVCVSLTELGFILVILTKIWRLDCSNSKKWSQTWPFLSHSTNLAFLWSWTALLGRTSAVVIVALQCIQLLVLAIPLRFSPLAILSRRRQRIHTLERLNTATTNGNHSIELRRGHATFGSNNPERDASTSTLYHASIRSAASV